VSQKLPLQSINFSLLKNESFTKTRAGISSAVELANVNVNSY
jgi:hypothetical protein